MKAQPFKTLLAIGLSLFLCVQAVAFQSSSLRLVLLDPNGDFVTNSQIRIKQDDDIIFETTNTEKTAILIPNLEQREYLVEINAPGFKPAQERISIVSGENKISITLELAEIEVEVEKTQSLRDEKLINPLGGFLTQEQIEALPETPLEIEAELRNRYGNQLKIRVDGVEAAIPDKSRIASIKVVMSSYDAQNHELGFVYIDIRTKMREQSWSGKALFVFNDDLLNARNAFAPKRLPSQDRQFNISLVGPLQAKKGILMFTFSRNDDSNEKPIIATFPNGEIPNSITSTGKQTGFSGIAARTLKNEHILRAIYYFLDSQNQNLGVGGFDTPERAYSQNETKQQLRITEAGYIANRFFNEFSFQYDQRGIDRVPETETSTIIVSDAFNIGGAGNASQESNKKIRVADNLLFGIGKNAVKIGSDLKLEKFNQQSRINENGTFLFSTEEDFSNKNPSLYTQSDGTRVVDFWQTQFSAFIQNDLIVKPGLSVGMGLRYEWQNQLEDFNNFSPRLSFTWSPLKSGKATFRGGVGVFYNWLDPSISASIFSQDSTQPSEIIVTNPDFDNPLASANGTVLPKSYRKFADDLKNPYVIHSSFSANFSLPKGVGLSANYVYQKGLHQFRSRNLNAPILGVRPNQDLGNIIQLESSGFFVRNSLEILFNARIFSKVYFNTRYTIAKKLSESDDIFGLPVDNYNLRADRGYSSEDRRHSIYSDVIFSIRKGMTLNFRHATLSPLPYSILTGFDDNQDTIFNDRPLGVSRNSLRGTWQTYIDAGFAWIYSFGRLKGERKGMQAMGQNPSDITTGNRRIAKKKRFALRLFVFATNIFNQNNATSFSGVQTSPFFRKPIAVRDSRKINLGIAFNF